MTVPPQPPVPFTMIGSLLPMEGAADRRPTMTIKKAYQAHDLTEALDRSWVGENDFYIADEDIEIIVHAAAAWEGYITGDAEIIQTDQGVGIRGVKMPGPEAE